MIVSVTVRRFLSLYQIDTPEESRSFHIYDRDIFELYCASIVADQPPQTAKMLCDLIQECRHGDALSVSSTRKEHVYGWGHTYEYTPQWYEDAERR